MSNGGPIIIIIIFIIIIIIMRMMIIIVTFKFYRHQNHKERQSNLYSLMDLYFNHRTIATVSYSG